MSVGMVIASCVVGGVVMMWVRWARRRHAAQGVPSGPIADRDDDDLHRIEGATVHSRNTGRLRAPSESGVVRLARGSVPPPSRTARGALVIPRPRSPVTAAPPTPGTPRDRERS